MSHISKAGMLIVGLAAMFAGSACGPNEAILKSNKNAESPAVSIPSNSTPQTDSVEKEVENMRTADFEIVLVLRRKDGGVMQPEDKAAVRELISNVNRRSLVDEDRAIVIGSNYPLPLESVKRIGERFTLENFSKPGAEITNSNTSANVNMKP